MFPGMCLSKKGLGTLFAYRFDKRNKLPQAHSWTYAKNKVIGMLHGGWSFCSRYPDIPGNTIIQWESEDKKPRFEDSGWLERLLKKIEELKKTK